jgi:predicted site-specific integrase-resolvase
VNTALLTKRDLAQQCRVSMRTIDGWIRDKKIPVIHMSQRCVRFRADRVAEALDRLETRAAGTPKVRTVEEAK